MKTFIEAIKNKGYKINKWGDAYDKGVNRVFFDDGNIIVIRFNDPKIQSIVAKSSIDTNIGFEAAIKVLEALEA